MSSMYCPHCGKLIEEGDIYCRHCGTKVSYSGEEEPPKSFEDDPIDQTFSHVKELQRQSYAHQEKMLEEKNKQEQFNQTHKKRGGCLKKFFAIIVGCCILVFGLTFYEKYERTRNLNEIYERETRESTAHSNETDRLNKIVDSIYKDIENGDYDLALMKANTLIYRADSGLTKYTAKKEWDQTRNNLIQLINEKRGVIPSASPEVSNFGSTPNWPKNEIAKLIPDPGTEKCSVSWEKEEGFVVTVSPYNREQYDKYVDACWNLGFTQDYNKTKQVFWGTNQNGYKISLRFESGTSMWVRIDAPGYN